MKTAIYNGKLITPAEVLENKVLVLENDRIIDILAEDVIDLGQYDEKIDAHGRYVCPGFIDTHSDKIEQIIQPRPTSVMDFEMGLKEIERQLINQGITTIYHSISLYQDDYFGASELRYKKNVLKLAELINNIHERHHLIHHRLHLRIEIDNLEAFDIVSKMLREKTVHEISFMDHTPGQGQYRNIETYRKTITAYHGETVTTLGFEGVQAVRQGKWNTATQFCLLDFPIVDLSGKTLGIIGYGELGKAVAKLAQAFGMQVLIAALPHRPSVDASRIALADLLPQVDFLTLHCPLTEQTQDLIAEQELALMKNSAFLINCARGGLVNEQALATALRQGMIAGAATDVLTVEPPKNGNVLLSADIPNLIITPHSAWGSRDSRQRMLQQLLENVMAFQAGKPIRQVN